LEIGPVGHYMANFFFPIHPIALAFFGFLGKGRCFVKQKQIQKLK